MQGCDAAFSYRELTCNPRRRYEIGEGLYIGWSSATLAICGGSCLMCACKLKTPQEKM